MNAAVGLVMLPLLAAVIVFVGRQRVLPWLPWVMIVVMLANLSQLVEIVTLEGVQRYTIAGWGAPLGIDWYVDGLTALMLVMTTLVGSGISIYANFYFHGATDARKQEQHILFWALWLVLWAGLNALFLSADFFNLYVTLEILTLAAVPLIILSGNATALQAGIRYLLIALFASLLYLLGVGFLYGTYGSLDIELVSQAMQPNFVTWLALGLILLGLITKSALFPMHFWLPPAHANAPAPISALLSALVVKSTFYVAVRVWFMLPDGFPLMLAGQLIGLLGVGGILWGSLQALRQTRLKLIVAYSTVAQLGYLFLLFPLAGNLTHSGEVMAWNGGIYQAFSHAFAKAAMFLAAGNVLHALATDRLDQLKGLAQHYPLTVFGFALSGVTIMAMPPSGGFIAKWLLLNSAFSSGQWFYAMVMLMGGLLAAMYVFKVLGYTFLAPKEGDAAMHPEQLHRLPIFMEVLPLLLASVALILGIITVPALELLAIGAPFDPNFGVLP